MKDELVVVILRPTLVTNSFDELVLNLFRINKFVVLDRVYKKLNDYEIQLLSRIECISETSYSNYHNIMTKGEVCIALLSGKAAKQKCKFLCDGPTFLENNFGSGGFEEGMMSVSMQTLMEYFM
jgi:hypothetical protein